MRSVFCKKIFGKRVHMSPPCQCIFFAINTRNAMKLHLHEVQSSLVVFLWIKFIDGCKKWLKIRHFIFKTKSLVLLQSPMSFDRKVITPPSCIVGIAKKQVAHCTKVKIYSISSEFEILKSSHSYVRFASGIKLLVRN